MVAILLCCSISAEANPALAAATMCHHFWGAGRLERNTVKFLHQQDVRASAHGQGWDSRGLAGKLLPLLCPQLHGNVLPKKRAGWCGKQDAILPQLSLYPADKAALIPPLSLNTCFVYTDVWVLTASTYRHASTCIYLLSTYIYICTRTHACTLCIM